MFTPAQLRPPMIRACSIFTQRSITTSSPASARDPRGLRVADAELHPQRRGADRDRLAGECDHLLRACESNRRCRRPRECRAARIALLAQHFRVAGIDRNDAVTVSWMYLAAK